MSKDMYNTILSLLERNDGLCLDNSEEREKLADFITDELMFQGVLNEHGEHNSLEVNLNIFISA